MIFNRGKLQYLSYRAYMYGGLFTANSVYIEVKLNIAKFQTEHSFYSRCL